MVKAKVTNIKVKLVGTALFIMLVFIFYKFHFGCVYQRIFHIPCPGCGLTRAWMQAIQLNFSQAFAYHYMFWSIPIIYIYVFLDGHVFQKKWINYGVLIFILFGFLITYVIHLIEYFNK